MPKWWNECNVCGKHFASDSPSANNCGDRKGHAELQVGKSKKRDEKKDGKK